MLLAEKGNILSPFNSGSKSLIFQFFSFSAVIKFFSFNAILLFSVVKLYERLLTFSSICNMTSCFYSNYVNLRTACIAHEDRINDFVAVRYRYIHMCSERG